jgi:hypothetical protein
MSGNPVWSALSLGKEREGGKFVESPSQNNLAGKVYINPFGSYSIYANNKGGYTGKSRVISNPSAFGYTALFIKKVFKGQLKYRTIRLYDDTWIYYCPDFLKCKFTNSPRESWYHDACYDGVSADGQQATFQYGPVTAPGKPGKNPGRVSWGGNWREDEWKNLPVGVQVK